MRNKWTEEKLNMALKQDRVADKEINDATQSVSVQEVMRNIERVRKSRQKKYPKYTQVYLAGKAGISRATYMSYLCGYSDNLKLKTLMNIVHELQCDIADVVKRGDAESDLGNSR